MQAIGTSAARVLAIRAWLDEHPAFAADDPAVRLGATLLLQDLAMIASYLRTSTTTALCELDRVGLLLGDVAKGLGVIDGHPAAARVGG